LKVVICNDTHWGCRNSHSVIEGHIIKFHLHLVRYIKENKIDELWILGDLFDKRKEVNFKTLDSCKKNFLDHLKTMDVPVKVIPGNHDTYFRNSNEITSTSLLLAGDDYPNVTVFNEPTEYAGVLFLPWINSNNFQESMVAIDSSKCMTCAAHLDITGFVMHTGVCSTDGFDRSVFERFSKVLTGHFHSKSDDGHIFYLGSQYDMTWADYGEKKYFHVFDTETTELTPVEYKEKLYVKLTYDDSKMTTADLEKEDWSRLKDKFVKVIVKTKKKPSLFDLFLDSIQSAGPYEVALLDDTVLNLSKSQENDILIEDTLTVIKKSVESIQSDTFDHNKLNIMMTNLYNRANAMEV
jgi:DNA repair exonuclease SbcCD nuclease subunit